MILYFIIMISWFISQIIWCKRFKLILTVSFNCCSCKLSINDSTTFIWACISNFFNNLLISSGPSYINEYKEVYDDHPNQLSFLSYDLVGLVYYLIFQNNFIVDEKIFPNPCFWLFFQFFRIWKNVFKINFRPFWRLSECSGRYVWSQKWF